MLVLPTGQVLFSGGQDRLYVWNPDGGPQDAWRPSISTITSNGNGTFTLTGSQLNGVTSGASYGDDAEMDENYPIIRLTDSANHVYYAQLQLEQDGNRR